MLHLNNNGICSGVSTKWLFIHCFQMELEFRSADFVEGGKPENPGRNSRRKDENQQQTQPTCVAGNRTRATAVGGALAIPAPPPPPSRKKKTKKQQQQQQQLSFNHKDQRRMHSSRMIKKLVPFCPLAGITHCVLGGILCSHNALSQM